MFKSLKEQRASARLSTPALDNDARAPNNLACLAVSIDLAKADPLAELLRILDLGKRRKVRSNKKKSSEEGNGERKISLKVLSFNLVTMVDP